jgi:hypothetical protein
VKQFAFALVWLAAAGVSARAQAPVVGDINFYGLRTLTPQHILQAVHLKSGDPMPPSKGDLEDRVAQIPGVVLARVEAICCDGRQAALFLGIEEKGAPHPTFRAGPTGSVNLPEDVLDLYGLYLAAVQRAAASGADAEDLTAGHAIMADPDARAVEDRFGDYATTHLDVLRDALRNDPDPEQRAVAAAIIGYAPNKADILADLQLAIQDPDETVRANALRALHAVAVLASNRPALGLRIPATWVIELLNSVVLTDRTEAVQVLLTLTDHGAPQVLDQIRERALDALLQMARWQTPRYGLPPFLLAGRLARMTDQQVQQAWQKGDREAVLSKAAGQTAPRKRLQ